MRRTYALAVVIVVGVTAGLARADCPLDHYKVGQHNGRMIVDNWQLYRHWNSDYGSNPDPYGQDYYEWIQTIMGTYNRTEPGPGYIDDANYHFPGTPDVDYRIMLQRIYASPEMSLYEGVSPILENDGDAICTSDYPEFHFHMRYLVADSPTEPRFIVFRYYDDFFDPNDPNAGGYAPSQPWVVHFGAEPNYYELNLSVKNETFGEIVLDPEPPLTVVPGAHYDPNHEPNDPPAYPDGVPVTLTAVPDSSRSFKEWQIYDPNHPGDANYVTVDSNTSITLVMNADREVTAAFTCGGGVAGVLPLAVLGIALCGVTSRRLRR